MLKVYYALFEWCLNVKAIEEIFKVTLPTETGPNKKIPDLGEIR